MLADRVAHLGRQLVQRLAELQSAILDPHPYVELLELQENVDRRHDGLPIPAEAAH